jgi:peptidoglycan-associated lipoprotein
VHFEFDRYDLKPEDQPILQQAANWLKANPSVYVVIGADADERGEIVYNLALSHKRAEVTRDALIGMGVSPSQIVFATGWGELYPTCTQSDESCWSQNRRAHFEKW